VGRQGELSEVVSPLNGKSIRGGKGVGKKGGGFNNEIRIFASGRSEKKSTKWTRGKN